MTTDAARKPRRIPSIVNTLNPLVRRLLGAGMPMGQNALLTVRGRTSGQLRSFADHGPRGERQALRLRRVRRGELGPQSASRRRGDAQAGAPRSTGRRRRADAGGGGADPADRSRGGVLGSRSSGRWSPAGTASRACRRTRSTPSRLESRRLRVAAGLTSGGVRETRERHLDERRVTDHLVHVGPPPRLGHEFQDTAPLGLIGDDPCSRRQVRIRTRTLEVEGEVRVCLEVVDPARVRCDGFR